MPEAKPLKNKPKKKKESFSIGGFLGNAASGVGNLVSGVATSPGYIGKAGYSDIKDLLDGGGFSSDLYGMGKSVVSGMKDYYAPLASGDFKQFAKNVYKDPVQLALDAATIVTLGGAGAAKAGQAVAKASKAGSTAAKLGEKAAGLSRVSAAQYAAQGGDDLARIAKYGKAIKSKDGASYLMPRTHLIESSTGKSVALKASANPVIAARQKMMLKAQTRLPETNYFSIDKKIGRMLAAPVERGIRRATLRTAAEVDKNVRNLGKADRTAIFYRAQGFNTVARLDALLRQRTQKIAEIEVKQAKRLTKKNKVYRARDKAALQADVERIAKVRENILNPSDDLLKVEGQILDLSDEVQKVRLIGGANPTDTRLRAELPLRSIQDDLKKIDPTEDLLITPEERLGIISHSEIRKMAKETRGGLKGSTGVIKGARKSTEDIESTGHAFRHGLYEADGRRVVKSYAKEINNLEGLQNFQNLLLLADEFDEAKHGEGLASGKLELMTPGSAEGKRVIELASFLEREILPEMKAARYAEGSQMGQVVADWAEAIQKGTLVIPTQAKNAMIGQTLGAQRIMQTILRRPTQVWRDITLSLKPSFYVNNFLGNMLLGLFAYGPEYLKELLDLRTSSHRGSLGKKLDNAAPDNTRGQINIMKAEGAVDGLPFGGGLKNPLNVPSRLANTKVQDALANMTEANFRRTALGIEVKRLAKEISDSTGISRGKAIDNILNDTRAVDALLEKAAGNMLDYTKLTPFEKNYLRTYYPFWNFIRASTGRMINLTLDEPWKVQVMAMMSDIQKDQANQLFDGIPRNEVPAYLRGLAPVGNTKDGKTNVVSLYAANPFGAPGDAAMQVAGIFDSKSASDAMSPMASMNPYIKSGFDAITGRDSFSGRELQGSFGEKYVNQLARNFPPISFYERARFPSQHPMIKRSLPQVGLQYAGLSTGEFDRKNLDRQRAIEAYYAKIDEKKLSSFEKKRAEADRGRLLGIYSG